MSISNLLNHKCDVYHLINEEVTGNFGLPGKKSTRFSDVPDIENLSCHFKVDMDKLLVVDSSQQEFVQIGALVVLVNSGIRYGDKIIDKETGLTYRALHPRSKRGNHIYVGLRMFKEVVK